MSPGRPLQAEAEFPWAHALGALWARANVDGWLAPAEARALSRGVKGVEAAPSAAPFRSAAWREVLQGLASVLDCLAALEVRSSQHGEHLHTLWQRLSSSTLLRGHQRGVDAPSVGAVRAHRRRQWCATSCGSSKACSSSEPTPT